MMATSPAVGSRYRIKAKEANEMLEFFAPGVDPGFPLWWIFPLLFGALWLLLIVFLILKLRWWGGWAHGENRPDAIAVLKERFARGEIDAEEYESRRRVLGVK
jgi:putative membrane protein